MNVSVLKYLSELANYQVDVINTDIFFARFPRESYTKELYELQRLGFVSLVSGDNQITTIGVNKKTIDYVKEISP